MCSLLYTRVDGVCRLGRLEVLAVTGMGVSAAALGGVYIFVTVMVATGMSCSCQESTKTGFPIPTRVAGPEAAETPAGGSPRRVGPAPDRSGAGRDRARPGNIQVPNNYTTKKRRRRCHVTATASMTTPPVASRAPAPARPDTFCPK